MSDQHEYPRPVGTEWETLTQPDVRHLSDYSLTTEKHPYRQVLPRWRVINDTGVVFGETDG